MISKQSVAFVIIFLLCAAGLIHTWLLDDGQELPVWWVWLPLLVLWLWAMWQLREPADTEAKAFDFNPKRGLLYFFVGLLVFPITVGVEALFGADLSVTGMMAFTLFASILAGVIGAFTEHVPL